MHPTRWKIHVSILSLGIVAAFAPITFANDGGVSAASAECTSCCKEMGTKCIKCVEDCVVIENAYDKGGGSCVSPIRPNSAG